jgi:hypothetical protein
MFDRTSLAREILDAAHNVQVFFGSQCALANYTSPAEYEGMAQSNEHKIEYFNADLPGLKEKDAVTFRDGRTWKVRQLLPVDEVGRRKAVLTKTP